MPLLDLHHVAIKSKDLDETEKFYTKVLGMKKVARPQFKFPGVWLKMAETMFHIYGGDAAKTHAGNYKYNVASSPVDHIALRAKGFDKMRSRITIRMASGGEVAGWADERYRGGPENPLSDAEVEDKLRSCCDGVLDAAAQDRLIAQV
mgnify:CR=1 FL=1